MHLTDILRRYGGPTGFAPPSPPEQEVLRIRNNIDYWLPRLDASLTRDLRATVEIGNELGRSQGNMLVDSIVRPFVDPAHSEQRGAITMSGRQIPRRRSPVGRMTIQTPTSSASRCRCRRRHLEPLRLGAVGSVVRKRSYPHMPSGVSLNPEKGSPRCA